MPRSPRGRLIRWWINDDMTTSPLQQGTFVMARTMSVEEHKVLRVPEIWQPTTPLNVSIRGLPNSAASASIAPLAVNRPAQLTVSSTCIHTRLMALCPRLPGWTSTRKIKHTRLTALFPGLPRWANTRKVKPIWILLEQETMSGSGISWAVCKSAPHCRQITMPVPNRSVFYRPDALPVAQPTASKHWRQLHINNTYR